MPHRTFLMFILPSLVVMLLFIAMPIISIAYQSLFIEHEQVMIEVENSGPFGTTVEQVVDAEAMKLLREEQPAGRFVGLQAYFNGSHLAIGELGEIWAGAGGLGEKIARTYNLPFYKALFFTLAYTAIVTPCAMALGFFIALGVNLVPNALRGSIVFFSLLPMIVTPLVGSLVLFWMIDARGILGSTLQVVFEDPNLSLKASAGLTWVTLFVYGIWHAAPFAFIVFFAGLQGVPKDTLESAMVDGANRWERIRFVVVPYLAPLATFVALIQLMDNFRVFEPIVGFSAEANATSLSYLIYSNLRSGEVPLFGSAAATSMLTIIGVAALLTPVLIRTYREFTRKKA